MQIICLSSFIAYGLVALEWTANIEHYVATLSAALITQLYWIRLKNIPWHSLKSGLITGLALCLLLKTSNPAISILAAAIAISGKFLIRVKGKHVFNPANAGIVLAVLLTGQAWISPGQWGSSMVILMFFTAAALMVLFKVGRIDTSVSFLLVYFGLEYLRSVLFKGWPPDYLWLQITNGTILLFAFFMITDPMTAPNHPKGRILWAATLAVLAFVLTNWLYVFTAPIWALFMLAPFTPLIDKIFTKPKYEWT